MPNKPALSFYRENTIYPIKIYEELFTDGHFYETSGVIKKFGNGFCFKIVGFLLLDNKIIVIFPKGFLFSNNKNDDAAVLLQVLLRYRNNRNLAHEEVQMLRGDNIFENGRIVSTISILDDYQKNGYLKRTRADESHDVQGFTDWNRTVKTCRPLLSHRRPVYINPVIRSTQTDTASIIARIHKFVIAECFSSFGWIYGNTIENSSEKMPLSSREAISILEMELQNTYVQREVVVLKLLIQYLSAKTGHNETQTIELLATPYFHNTWEAICGYIFENQYATLKEIIPHPKWKNAKVNGHISQRPDILYKSDSKLYILDAKYYDYKKNLPGWHDVVKQLFYKFTIEKSRYTQLVTSKDTIFTDIVNVFILPENSNDDLVHLGDIYVENVDELGELHVFSVNTRNAMHLYAYKKKSTYRSLLEHNIKIILS